MTADEVNRFLQADPFVPFVIVSRRTGRYEVGSPKGVYLTTGTLHLPKSLTPEGLADGTHSIPIAQIARLIAKESAE